MLAGISSELLARGMKEQEIRCFSVGLEVAYFHEAFG